MMNKDTGYKIVERNIEGTRFLSPSLMWGSYCVEYKLNKFVKANDDSIKRGYHLFYFKSKKIAKKYAKESSLRFYNIFKCKIKNEIKQLPEPKIIYEKSRIDWDWSLTKYPEGTHMAKEIMLLEEII